MAKNKNSKNRTGQSATNKYTAGNASQSQTNESTKNSHAQVPDSSPNRSGPGGEQCYNAFDL